jgi:hypothetical protein
LKVDGQRLMIESAYLDGGGMEMENSVRVNLP